MAGLFFGKNLYFEVGFEVGQRGFLSKKKEKVILCRGAEDGKGMGTNTGWLWEPTVDSHGNQQRIVMGTNSR